MPMESLSSPMRLSESRLPVELDWLFIVIVVMCLFGVIYKGTVVGMESGLGVECVVFCMSVVTARALECECGGVLIGSGPMGPRRRFRCQMCGSEVFRDAGEGVYIEFEYPDFVSLSDIDGPLASYGVPEDVSLEEYLEEYVSVVGGE